ncbi:MAG: condensation domain-containing protein, partial [Paracoccaceae bacterium]
MSETAGATTPIEDFVAELAGRDVKLWLDDGQLRCNAPNDVLTPQLQAKLVERKADLCAFLGRTNWSEGARDLTPVPRDGEIPLTHSQERIWSLSEMRPTTSVYNKTAAYRLAGALDAPALERSLSELQRRHEILRTSFPA